MSIIRNLFGMWIMGKTLPSAAPIFIRLLFGVVAITAIAVFLAILAAALVVSSLWFLYGRMLAHGMDPQIAFISITCIVVALISIAMICMQTYWRSIRKLSKRMFFLQRPLAAHLSGIADSFVSGFLSHTSKR